MPHRSPPPLPPAYFGESKSAEKPVKKTPEKKSQSMRRKRDDYSFKPKGGRTRRRTGKRSSRRIK